jgi:MSHA biogenesis protein MshJ
MMIALGALNSRVRPLIERLDQRSLRERALVFATGVALIYCLWQLLLMDPLMARARAAESRLNAVRDKTLVVDQAGAAVAQDPSVIAVARNRALKTRLRDLDAELARQAQGYVSPSHMIDMLREVLTRQRGLHLVSLTNLPPRSLAKTDPREQSGTVREGHPTTIADPGAARQPRSKDPGPFLHPVEIVVEGDYLAVAAYLHELEQLAWKIHWDRLEVDARHSPDNRVRIVIGALSLSPEWITV